MGMRTNQVNEKGSLQALTNFLAESGRKPLLSNNAEEAIRKWVAVCKKECDTVRDYSQKGRRADARKLAGLVKEISDWVECESIMRIEDTPYKPIDRVLGQVKAELPPVKNAANGKRALADYSGDPWIMQGARQSRVIKIFVNIAIGSCASSGRGIDSTQRGLEAVEILADLYETSNERVEKKACLAALKLVAFEAISLRVRDAALSFYHEFARQEIDRFQF